VGAAVVGSLAGVAVAGGVVVAGMLLAGVVVGALVGAAVVEGAAVVVGWSAPGVPALVVGCAAPAWWSAAMAAGGAQPSSAATTKAANSRRDGRVLLMGPGAGEQRQATPESVLTIRSTRQTPHPPTLRPSSASRWPAWPSLTPPIRPFQKPSSSSWNRTHPYCAYVLSASQQSNRILQSAWPACPRV
jgi:hypothetical protein